MKAVIYDAFSTPPRIEHVADPTPDINGVVVQVMATGVCRSDWHGWMGNDPTINLPHVPGHELAGVVVAVGADVAGWKTGDRVTLPFVGGCGSCMQCRCGNQQVCDHQFQPGFTHWGSFAQWVAIGYADTNLVRIPEAMDFPTAASLGCRFATSFRAIVDQGKVTAGQWVVVHGCGGVGLSAIMIANALGARVIAVDVSEEKLALAKSLGACAAFNASTGSEVVDAVIELTSGGAHVSIDALGHPDTCFNSISNLRKRGKHIQIGLCVEAGGTAKIPLAKIIASELEIYGSHGMQAHRYDAMLALIQSEKVSPAKLIGKTVSLEQSIDVLINMDKFHGLGTTVITEF